MFNVYTSIHFVNDRINLLENEAASSLDLDTISRILNYLNLIIQQFNKAQTC